MIVIAAMFLIAFALIGASLDAMIKERRRYERAVNSHANGHFAQL